MPCNHVACSGVSIPSATTFIFNLCDISIMPATTTLPLLSKLLWSIKDLSSLITSTSILLMRVNDEAPAPKSSIDTANPYFLSACTLRTNSSLLFIKTDSVISSSIFAGRILLLFVIAISRSTISLFIIVAPEIFTDILGSSTSPSFCFINLHTFLNTYKSISMINLFDSNIGMKSFGYIVSSPSGIQRINASAPEIL